MHCSKCGVENRAAARFCDGCGSAMQPQCASCGALNRVGAKFCDGCGVALTGPTSAAAATSGSTVRFNTDIAAADVTNGERKTVTALFADIKGSTELMEDLDPEQARAIGLASVACRISCRSWRPRHWASRTLSRSNQAARRIPGRTARRVGWLVYTSCIALRYPLSCSSNALASFKSAVSKPSVNQS